MKNKIILQFIFLCSVSSATAQDGIVSDFHKSNMGKILFTKNVNLDAASAGSSDFQTVFTNKDEIAACVFTQLNDYGQVNYKGRLFIDGTEPVFEIENTKYKAAFVTYLLANEYSTESADFSNFILEMKSEHKVRMEIWDKDDRSKKIIATGEFTISKSSAPEASPTLKFSAVKAGMSNPTLEQQALIVINTRAKNENWDEKYKKAKIISAAWEVRKNSITGVIEDRIIYMKLLGVWSDGKCKIVDFGFRQDYEGSQYSALKFNSIGEMTPAICE